MCSNRTHIEIPSAPHLEFETALWQQGVRYIAGVDEAGRGALAGPVAAAAVILPPNPGIIHVLQGVRDSKEMTARARLYWASVIHRSALAWAVGYASAREIDRYGILPATLRAAGRALQALVQAPEWILSDYLKFPLVNIPVEPLIKGDARSLSIAAASVLAKTARDKIMETLDQRYPGYGLAGHKGYGTLAHRQALSRLGLSRTHRRSFSWRLPATGGDEYE